MIEIALEDRGIVSAESKGLLGEHRKEVSKVLDVRPRSLMRTGHVHWRDTEGHLIEKTFWRIK